MVRGPFLLPLRGVRNRTKGLSRGPEYRRGISKALVVCLYTGWELFELALVASRLVPYLGDLPVWR